MIMTCVSAQLQSYLEISEYQVLYKGPIPIPECVCTEPPAYLSINQVISHVRYTGVCVCMYVCAHTLLFLHV